MAMTMKKFIYLATAVIAMAFAASCTKASEGLTGITYYPVLTLEGDDYMVVDKGAAFVDPGYTATLNGEDVTDQVVVDSNVNTAQSGIYYINYTITNVDGFSSSASREIVVLDPNDPIEGFWYSTTDSYRLYGGNQVAYKYNLEVLIINQGNGVYYFDDLLAGWYCQRAGYGSRYAMGGHVKINGSTISLVDSYIQGWGDSLLGWADGKYENDTISYVATYVSGMEFHVTLTK